MHIIMRGTTTALGLDALLATLWSISEDLRLPIGELFETVRLEGTFRNEAGTAFTATRTQDDAELFFIEGSLSEADAETVIRLVRQHPWESEGDDRLGPILREEITLEAAFWPRASQWPRPSSRP